MRLFQAPLVSATPSLPASQFKVCTSQFTRFRLSPSIKPGNDSNVIFWATLQIFKFNVPATQQPIHSRNVSWNCWNLYTRAFLPQFSVCICNSWDGPPRVCFEGVFKRSIQKQTFKTSSWDWKTASKHVLGAFHMDLPCTKCGTGTQVNKLSKQWSIKALNWNKGPHKLNLYKLILRNIYRLLKKPLSFLLRCGPATK